MARTVRSPTATEPVGAIIGRFAHVLIGDLLDAGVRDPSSRALMQASQALDLASIPTMRPYAVAQQLAATAALYLRVFALRDPWRLVGREHTAGGCRFDLVFRNDAGDVLVDEIKTGRFEQALELRALETQLARHLTAGAAEWGAKFQGVRTILLGAPRRSAIHHPDGTSTPVRWDVPR
jgi:hypothetical protein